jgi:flagellar motor switch protein FliN
VAPVHSWIFDELCARLAAAIEGMTGARPTVEWRAAASAPTGPVVRRMPFTGVSGAIWAAASEQDAAAVGNAVLRAAEVEETDPAKLRAEFFEVLNQAASGLAQAMTAKLGREVVSTGGEAGAVPQGLLWAGIEVKDGTATVQLSMGVEEAFAASLESAPQAAQESSKTFDLLLDVEMPVSVSFGRAQVQLKDVLKLTTGSVVELNRAIADPVEVIVNNCVIARGEVVVVDGNFGVRIQNVISRQERLRTLN